MGESLKFLIHRRHGFSLNRSIRSVANKEKETADISPQNGARSRVRNQVEQRCESHFVPWLPDKRLCMILNLYSVKRLLSFSTIL